MMYIPVILGTAREGRQSIKVASYVLEEVRKAGLDSGLVDVRDYRIDATDNTKESSAAKRLAEKIKKADALIIVTPEYNHGYPGELKMMLDLLYEDYFGKPLGICGVSSGGLGGARAVEQLRLVSVEFHMVPIREAIYFSKVGDLFDAGGRIRDGSYGERIKVFLGELTRYAKALREAGDK